MPIHPRSPQWVIRRHSRTFGAFPLYPRKQTSTVYECTPWLALFPNPAMLRTCLNRKMTMLNQAGITEKLAHNIVATRWDDIPPQVQHQAKRSLINFFAATLAGCRSRPIEIALALLGQFSGGR